MDSSSSLLGLVVTCGAMFIGAFAAGLSCYKFSRRQLAWINCFAAGLLLGTSIGVIIPEGVRSLYSLSSSHDDNHDDHDHDPHNVNEDSHQGHTNNERILGWTMLLGFLTMMVLDDAFAFFGTAASDVGHHSHSHWGGEEKDENDESMAVPLTNGTRDAEKRRFSVTLGLVIHNAMDGLAMGAAKSISTSSQNIVFWAIMMHHVPAAFGYASLLRNSGLEEFMVRRLMILFSVSAPLSCAITFFLLHPEFGLGLVEEVSSQLVGICLLYSAGTFLFVACVHALEEAKNGFPQWGLPQVAVLVSGALVPGLLSWNHKH